VKTEVNTHEACAALCYSCRTVGAPKNVNGEWIHTTSVGSRLVCRAAVIWKLASVGEAPATSPKAEQQA